MIRILLLALALLSVGCRREPDCVPPSLAIRFRLENSQGHWIYPVFPVNVRYVERGEIKYVPIESSSNDWGFTYTYSSTFPALARRGITDFQLEANGNIYPIKVRLDTDIGPCGGDAIAEIRFSDRPALIDNRVHPSMFVFIVE